MKNMYLTRKEKITLSTIDLINELGIKDLSIKEIAKKESITEAAIYKHFKSKEQILIEVLGYYSRYDNNIINTLKNNNLNEKENIYFFFKMYSEYYESYPAVTAIYDCYHVLIYDINISSEIKNIFNQRAEFIKQLIAKGQKKGNIKESIQCENLSDILFGTFERIIFRWRLSDYKFSLKEKTMEVIRNILSTC